MKLFYALTDNKKLAIDDFIIRTKFKGNRETFLQECIIQYNLVILDWVDSGKVQKSDGKIVEFDVDKAMETKLIKQAPQFNGNKAVFVVGKGTYENFIKGCKIENYLRKRDKTGEPISLEEWFNNFVNTQAWICMRANVENKMRAEFNQVRSEKPDMIPEPPKKNPIKKSTQ